jgi:hypothetical protein
MLVINSVLILVMLGVPPNSSSAASRSRLDIGVIRRDVRTLRITFHNHGKSAIRLPASCTLELVRDDADGSNITVNDAFRADIPLSGWPALAPGEVRSVTIRADDLLWAPSVSAVGFTGVFSQVVKPGRYAASIHVETGSARQSSRAVPYAVVGVATGR